MSANPRDVRNQRWHPHDHRVSRTRVLLDRVPFRIVESAVFCENLLREAEPWVAVESRNPFVSERGLDTEPTSKSVRCVQSACRALGLPAEPLGMPYGTDAARLWPGGFDCVVVGPGNVAQAHTTDEWVSLDEVAKCAELYVEIVRRFAKS